MQLGTALAEVDTLALEGRTVEARARLADLARAGDAAALFQLADWNYRGVGGPQDLHQARTLFAAAADKGIEVAGHVVTNFMATGTGGPRDWPQALRRLEVEAATSPQRKHARDVIRAMDLDVAGNPVAPPEEQTISDAPRVSVLTALLSPAECAYLIAIAEPLFARSVIRDKQTGKEHPDPVRTSDQATIHWAIEDPVAHAINQRIATATATDVDVGEPMQILSYSPGQEFRRHVDADLGQPALRIKTALIYLNEDYEGGETLFTRTGMFVRGGTGDAIIFNNTTASGEVDQMSEHAGLPVTSGRKLLASRWICDRPFRLGSAV